MPLSRCNNITLRNNQVDTKKMLDVKTSDKYELIDFTLDGSPIDFSQFAPATKDTAPKVYL
jgi:hypothetical protein